jgi:hypothetical protein
LRGLESFKQINGLRFRELPKKLQNALKIRPYLRVITLLRQSHPELKYEVFIRLNRGGIRLNNQEIRNVAFRGPLNDAIYTCAEHQLLRKALKVDGPKAAAYQQMQDAEYVLRFFTLVEVWESFSGSLVRSMDHFMLQNRDAEPKVVERLAQDFNQTLERTHRLWGNMAFQRWDGERWRQQALAGLFDAQMIACFLLSEKDFARAEQKRSSIINHTKRLFADPNFEEAVRLGTNTPARLRFRVNAVREILTVAQ